MSFIIHPSTPTQAARARELAKKLAKEEARKQQEEAVRRKQEGKGKGKNKEKAAPVVVMPKDVPAPDKMVLPADKNPIKVRCSWWVRGLGCLVL